MSLPRLLLLALCATGQQLPPQASSFQRELWLHKDALAAQVSEAARPALLTLLQQPELRSWLRNHGLSSLVGLTGPELLERLHEEVRATEITTGFLGKDSELAGFLPLGRAVGCGLMNLSIARRARFLYNSWELRLRELRNCSSGLPGKDMAVEDRQQQQLFGCRPFKHGTANPSTHEEAWDRIVYAAVNVRRLDVAECQFGSVRAVLSTAAIGGMALLAPLDTGWWSKCLWNMSDTSDLNCSGWQEPYHVGTLRHMDHTLLAHARLLGVNFNGSAAKAMGFMLTRLVKPENMPLNTGDSPDVMGYLEAAVLGSIIYPRAVKAIVANFQNLYGDSTGEELIQWCQTHGWPLLWTFGISPPDGRCAWNVDRRVRSGHRESFTTPRLLEPRTAAAVNASLPRHAAGVLAAIWAEAVAARNRSAAAWWARAAAALGPRGQLRPLRAFDCSDAEGAVGVDGEGSCVSKVAVLGGHDSAESLVVV